MTTANLSNSQSLSLPVKLFLSFTGVIGIYYVATRAFPMLIPTEDNYGPYFYWRAKWLLPHVILGIFAALIGPFQFIKAFRDKYLNTHRLMGKIYLISILLSGLTGIYLAFTSKVNLAYATGLFFLGFCWISSSLMAYMSIRRKKLDLHKEWMIRSYTITLGFVTFRFFVDLIKHFELASNEVANTMMAWASWAVPLFLVELYLQAKKI